MIGEKIRKIRIIRGYSQEYIADLLEISQSAYSDIERGKTKINLERLRKVALIFELDVNYIIDFSESQFLTRTTEISSKEMDSNEKRIIIESFNLERELYKEQIANLKNEIAYLRSKLDKNKL
ncbi:DNA-binding XRE family transcriptional regulator [Flavobacterium sp. 90]|uniref:helix-turn-helix domain-containing protein n=1 Tax=unclassified Flavobacterium TaxID=196869 RepID=UPI000EAF220D|nr:MULTISPECIES: helix-turn-helix transcriptional regulator [unclassified Flavobacterium]RKR08841.1 DNA-binding XRE family transcriptional regulator [Flavobacterium sp. 81]TCK52628.1 DNA-binding XRE family transcriptional regulator [Flavobacterium sp. 90]